MWRDYIQGVNEAATAFLLLVLVACLATWIRRKSGN